MIPEKRSDKQLEIRARNAKLTGCAFCGAPLGNLFYFCREHFFAVPGNERAKLYEMHRRCEDVTSKIEKICRILRKKHGEPKKEGGQ